MNSDRSAHTETERTALAAAFMAAAVVAGLSLSLVPNVELVTLTVFTGGFLLGPARGASIGAGGMTLYHFANSALRGFPPSLPFLAAQVAGLALAGAAGGWWRRPWRAGGRTRRIALLALPVLGAALATVTQTLLNLVGAALVAAAGAFWPTFVSGMAFGAVQILANAIAFGVAGPAVAHAVGRAARRRAWWGAAGSALALVCVSPAAAPASAADPPAPSAPPDTVAAEPADGLAEPVEFPEGGSASPPPRDIIPADTLVAGSPWRPLRPLRLHPDVLWVPLDGDRPALAGAPTFAGGGALEARVTAAEAAPSLATAWEGWGLGWGRTAVDLDGVPLGGPIHALNEPPDLPLAWMGAWRETWTAAGTRIDLGAAEVDAAVPRSRILLTTGTFGRRTTEFSLYRNLRDVNLGVDFMDREESMNADIGSAEATRLWLRLESIAGRRPDWSIDLADGIREHTLGGGGSAAENARRLQMTLTGPLAGGETRVALHARRHAWRSRPAGSVVDELVFDGFTLQADWAPPLSGTGALRVRWERDRRRGVLPDAVTLDGLHAAWIGAARAGGWSVGAEVGGGTQEPWGGTWRAALAAAREGAHGGFRLSASHEERSPALVPVLDDPIAAHGLDGYLETAESAAPEIVDALRAEGRWAPGGAEIRVGAWGARERGYRIDAVPSWSAPGSPYAPVVAPSTEADVLGAYGRLRLPFPAGFSGEGGGRVSDRDLAEVPYLPEWVLEGSLHAKRALFDGSLELDASLGGTVLGPRENPAGERYGTATLGHLRLAGRIDRGTVSFAVENLADAFVESAFRAPDAVTPILVPGRRYVFGIAMTLED